jgi:transcriptional regulator with XRE-family HTH domain
VPVLGGQTRQLRVRLGQALRTAREAAGIRRSTLAAQLGVTHSYLWRIENGRSNLTIDQAEALASSIGCEIVVSLKRLRLLPKN